MTKSENWSMTVLITFCIFPAKHLTKMQVFLIYFFFLFLLLFLILTLLLKVFESHSNKKSIKCFLANKDTTILGEHRCSVTKNTLSPKNYNFFFDSANLIRINDYLLICPQTKILGIQRILKPFILSNSIGKHTHYVDNIDVFPFDAKNNKNGIVINLTAPLNTKLQVNILNAHPELYSILSIPN